MKNQLLLFVILSLVIIGTPLAAESVDYCQQLSPNDATSPLPFAAPNTDIVDCRYYLDREKDQSCGPDGYYIGFGYRYCHTFIAANRDWIDFSNKGYLWLTNVGLCLQKALHQESCKQALDKQNGIANPRLSCKEIGNFAMNSHTACYLRPVVNNPKISVCNLPITDYFVLPNVIKKTFKDPRVWQQMDGVIEHCGSELLFGK